MITWKDSKGYIVKESKKLHLLEEKSDLNEALDTLEKYDDIKVFKMELKEKEGENKLEAHNVPLGEIFKELKQEKDSGEKRSK